MHSHTAAGIDIPGTVWVPGKKAICTGAVLDAVGQGQLDQLRTGPSKEQLLQKKWPKSVSGITARGSKKCLSFEKGNLRPSEHMECLLQGRCNLKHLTGMPLLEKADPCGQV